MHLFYFLQGRPIVLEVSTRVARSELPPQPLALARSIPRGAVFSLFVQNHRLAAKELCDYFMGEVLLQTWMNVSL